MAKQRVAVVTGGMGGLGETISTKMADAGYRVIVTYSPSNTKYKSWLEEMKGRGYGFSAFPVDVVDYDSCAKQCSIINGEFGAIDILVNNAGITRDMTFKKMTKADWDAVMRTNLDSCFNMTKQVMDGMVDRGWGRIINVSSVNGQKGAFGQTNYSAAKAGIHGFTKALALEVAKKGVTINTIYPEGNSRHENPAADSDRAARQARRSRGPHHLPVLRGGGVRHRRQHLHQRRPAHVLRG